MPAPFWKPRQRPATVALVLALHLVLLAGALRLGVWPERTAPTSRPPLTVQLIWQRLTSATLPAQPPKSEVQPVQPTRATRTVQEDLPTTTNAPATAEPALQAITQPAAAPSEPATPAATAASAPVHPEPGAATRCLGPLAPTLAGAGRPAQQHAQADAGTEAGRWPWAVTANGWKSPSTPTTAACAAATCASTCSARRAAQLDPFTPPTATCPGRPASPPLLSRVKLSRRRLLRRSRARAASSCRRSTRRCTLPVVVIGNWSMNSISFGYS
jgi:hypothetical protein